MSAAARASHRAEVPAIPTTADFRARVKEAALAVESALLAAEMLSTHGIIESVNFERMIDLLQEATAAIDQIDVGFPPAPTVIFPTRVSAEAFIAQHPLDADHLYRIQQDGVGRCAIAVFRLIAHL
jgi:hypothetical protein